MSAPVGIPGLKINKLTSIRYAHNGKWLFECECGNETKISWSYFIKGNAKACIKCRWDDSRSGLQGNKFGKWTVLQLAEPDKKKGLWLCQCECGKISKVQGYRLKNGKNNGCLKCKKKKGVGVAAFNRLYSSYQRQAKKRYIEWYLTENQFRELVNSNCYYTGLPPSSIMKCKGGTYIYNGIDRLNSLEGYNINNCVPCNGTVNRMKMELDYSAFIEMCTLIVKNINNNNECKFKVV